MLTFLYTQSAFAYCRSLKSITIPPTVDTIHQGSFKGCRSLTHVYLPPSVTSIEAEAFGYCSSLTSINLPWSLSALTVSAFKNCASLVYIQACIDRRYYPPEPSLPPPPLPQQMPVRQSTTIKNTPGSLTDALTAAFFPPARLSDVLDRYPPHRHNHDRHSPTTTTHTPHPHPKTQPT